MEITEVAGYKNGEIILNPIYVFEEIGQDNDGIIEGCLRRTENPLVNNVKAKQRRVELE